MSDEPPSTGSVDAQSIQLPELWMACLRQAQFETLQAVGQFAHADDPRAWRQAWLDRLGERTDELFRQPPFLSAMRAHVDAWVTTQASRTSSVAGDVSTLVGTSPAGQSDAARHEVVFRDELVKLVRYASPSRRFAEPLVVSFSLVNRPQILDLGPDRSVIRVLLEQGFDVYLIDWGVPGDSHRQLRIEDYVSRFLATLVSAACHHAGTSQVNLLGYCMGGTLATIYAAVQPASVRNLILMATPIDFSRGEGLLSLWAHDEHFDVDRMIDQLGNCPGEFLRHAFQLMKPIQNLIGKYLTLSEHLHDSAFLENFVALERWAQESIPVAGETFRQFVKQMYQQNQLATGRFLLAGQPVRLGSVSCPVLLLVAERDHLVPPEASLALRDHVRSSEVKVISVDTGHIGLAVSSQAHTQLWPHATQWMAQHSTPVSVGPD